MNRHPNISKDTSRVVLIGGVDSSGGAGLSTDLKAQHSLGINAKCVTTYVTAQTHGQVSHIEPVAKESLLAQLNSVLSNDGPFLVKLGMVGTKGILEQINIALSKVKASIVCDPVYLSSSGAPLMEDEALEFYKKVIFPKTSLLTPNLPEAEKILGKKASSLNDIEKMGEDFLNMGVQSVLIKGGHFFKGNFLLDYFCSKEKKYWIKGPRIKSFKGETIRGTGCFLASAITGAKSLGLNIIDSVLLGRTLLNSSIRRAEKEGETFILSVTSVDNFESEDFPWIESETFSFSSMENDDSFPWLYPIVDRASWITRLAPYKVNILQLRIKDLEGESLEKEIKKAIELSKKFQIKLFINDFWELALKYNAYGVHLGQEDLENAHLKKIKEKGLKLGLSSHSYEEGAIAKGIYPSYVALGPIYFTQLKAMDFAPQGVEAFKTWKKLFSCPVVAIGGINLDRLPEVMKANPDIVSVVRDITLSKNPEERTLHWQKAISRNL
ncbi:PfkB family carbohydrate kinase [Bacteriovoracales bacterium]|nr:PfkB family carbohydrate kinase [Bacteriovoracales bacterium]